jgi:hypothetical protein
VYCECESSGKNIPPMPVPHTSQYPSYYMFVEHNSRTWVGLSATCFTSTMMSVNSALAALALSIPRNFWLPFIAMFIGVNIPVVNDIDDLH